MNRARVFHTFILAVFLGLGVGLFLSGTASAACSVTYGDQTGSSRPTARNHCDQAAAGASGVVAGAAAVGAVAAAAGGAWRAVKVTRLALGGRPLREVIGSAASWPSPRPTRKLAESRAGGNTKSADEIEEHKGSAEEQKSRQAAQADGITKARDLLVSVTTPGPDPTSPTNIAHGAPPGPAIVLALAGAAAAMAAKESLRQHLHARNRSSR